MLNTRAPKTSTLAKACLSCRSRHLKCSGSEPCVRCQSEGDTCIYLKSRRGYKGPRKNKHAISGDERISDDQHSQLDLLGIGLASKFYTSPELPITLNANHADQPLQLSANRNLDSHLPNDSSNVTDLSQSDTFNAFYGIFYSNHPFLLPRVYLIELLKEKTLPHLELVIRYIGSHYVSPSSISNYRDALDDVLENQTLFHDGFMVQTLLLFAIVLHADDEVERSAQCLDSAISLALELGMHRTDFAQCNAENNPLIEESWRRTWWELYVTEGFCASVTQDRQFSLWGIPCDVCLPCEEASYFSGDIPLPHSVAEYDESSLMETDTSFSSFAYLFDAVRCLGKILAVNESNWTQTDACQYHALDAAEISLMNWSVHLPASKKEPVDMKGQVNEVLFRAHMIISVASILLHRPRSHLGFRRVQNVKTCVITSIGLRSNQMPEGHTAKAFQAAKHVTQLMMAPTPLQNHSPFLSCSVVMASIIHLSLWSFMIPDGENASIKDVVRLDIGVLKLLGELWPVSRRALGQVRDAAQEMLVSKRALRIHSWDSMTGNEILQNEIRDIDTVDHLLRSELLDYPPMPGIPGTPTIAGMDLFE